MKSALLLMVVIAAPLDTHQGTNISYEHNKPTAMPVVTEFVWQNPHSQLYFDIKRPDGNRRVLGWQTEQHGKPGQRWKVHSRTLKASDQLKISLFPSKAGSPVAISNRISSNTF
jgi:hypothetical protein